MKYVQWITIQSKKSGGNSMWKNFLRQEVLSREELFRGNCSGVVVFGGIIQGVIILGGNFIGDNCPGGGCPGRNYLKVVVRGAKVQR